MELYRMSKVENIGTEKTIAEVGDRLRFTLEGGEEVEAIAVRREENGMLFIFTDCLRDEYRLHEPGKYPGWEDCELRRKLNGEILERFPEDVLQLLMPFSNGDLLRIPTEKEIFGENEYGKKEPENVEQFEIMKDRRNRIAFQGFGTGDWEWYWLQNRGVSSATWAAIVDWNGDAYWWSASDVDGVRPLFIADL